MLSNVIEFACGPLVEPFRWVGLEDRRDDYYLIEAVAPLGTTIDQARGMLRRALAERMGFRYHIENRREDVLLLVRGPGPLKLVASTPGDSKKGTVARDWQFKQNAASISELARFLGTVAGMDVVDKTAISGLYYFDIDWRNELHQGEIRANGPGMAKSGAKWLGLTLAHGTESRKVLVVDHIDKLPTAN
jgi:uncharacterized protein (TIGR03435 family)